ncbi:bacillithiol biosynthesis deacetylase BshB1 [Ferviditalea candida]|uniref:Bacillithiol biosynthesis deacetylase BshB1 n=1 Tax=Ferviditalea candida TaxID=3108399 RepID=A0ABU5ZFM2_9BACL|nr:bacillithiol biosynthesis deacetylase BshB1 [Paenibacillaceae bacterium T2]
MTQSLDILIFGAHPDDAEIGMGATIYKHTQVGYRVGICDLTRAEMSSNGTVETRRLEAETASQILGLSVRANLELPDRGLTMEAGQVAAIAKEIRRHRPKIVFAPFWQDRHPDHVMCSHLVGEAVFNAKLRKYLPEFEPVQVEQVYYYFINDVQKPDLLVDVSDVYEHKLAALRAYQSQFMPPAEQEDRVETPLNRGYLENVEARDRVLGQQSICRYAEGFISKQPYRVNFF